MKKAWKGILGLLMAMTFTVSAGRMVYAETVDENHEEKEKLEAQQKEKNRETSARGRGKGG